MKTIPLTQNKYALVDDEDYEYLSKWKWHAHKGSSKYTYYAVRTSYDNGKTQVRMHREIVLRYTANNKEEIDHVDRDGLNNKKCNLRICSISENNFNRRNWGSLPKGIKLNKSTYKKKNGEIKEYLKYQARISVNGKSVHLGNYNNLENAIDSYNNASKKYYPEYT